MTTASPEVPVTIIEPRKGWISLDLKELWEYRELLTVLAGREIRVRYKQTFLGAAWAVIKPFTTMVIFTIFFGKLAGLDQKTGGIPYPIFTFAALVPWYYFAHSWAGAAGSVVEHKGIITKVYFPRLILPAAPLLSGLVDFSISMVVLFGLMLWYGIVPTPAVLALPGFILLAMLTAFAFGLWIAALNAHYRDFRYIVPFLLQLGFFASPIAYPSGLIEDEGLRALYGLNPMAGVVEGFRWALLGQGQAPGLQLWISAGVVLLLLWGGLVFFRRFERTFVDVV